MKLITSEFLCITWKFRLSGLEYFNFLPEYSWKSWNEQYYLCWRSWKNYNTCDFLVRRWAVAKLMHAFLVCWGTNLFRWLSFWGWFLHFEDCRDFLWIVGDPVPGSSGPFERLEVYTNLIKSNPSTAGKDASNDTLADFFNQINLVTFKIYIFLNSFFSCCVSSNISLYKDNSIVSCSSFLVQMSEANVYFLLKHVFKCSVRYCPYVLDLVWLLEVSVTCVICYCRSRSGV